MTRAPGGGVARGAVLRAGPGLNTGGTAMMARWPSSGHDMGQVLIRDLDDGVLAALRARAVARGVSLGVELRDILTRAAMGPRRAVADEFAAIRALTPHGPGRLAEDLVREGRDER